MIQIEYKDGGYRPFFVCDICREPIREVRNALARGQDALNKPGKTIALHLHKGACDLKATKQFGDSGSEELSHHLIRITHNCGATPKQLEQAKKDVQELGQLFFK